MGARKRKQGVPDPEVRERTVVRRCSAAYKARILQEYEQLDKAGKGALLRREGLYSSLISSGREPSSSSRSCWWGADWFETAVHRR
ncbi:hypothetical protein [Nonomuraea basaltis]|uniref:hypothetical protein n=1 Tax=Nonomuraea basaltis TaxID=2495887 RepID=UPI00110C5C07|nr:hypothetical protein [Nonomuraea basaltis]TMR92652.1 hypothetical protein EJK15_43385 [Nonomuraea basaltis]